MTRIVLGMITSLGTGSEGFGLGVIVISFQGLSET